MFRKMRRIKQLLADEEAVSILVNGKTGILGVNGDDGYPYTVPVNYVYRDGKIYIHGAKSGHKIDALRRCDKVSFCVIQKDDIVPERITTYFRSAIAFGRARILEGPEEIRQAAMALGMKYCADESAVRADVDKEFNALACLEIVIEHLTGKESIELVRARNIP